MRERFLLCVLLSACGSTPPANPTLTEVQSQVFKISCALSSSCHSGSNPMEGLSLDAPVYAKIVNVTAVEVPTKLVVPGSLTGSFLWNKVSSASPTAGAQMPLGGTPLDATQMALLQDWIMTGAPNN